MWRNLNQIGRDLVEDSLSVELLSLMLEKLYFLLDTFLDS